jgi:putative endonuclease
MLVLKLDFAVECFPVLLEQQIVICLSETYLGMPAYDPRTYYVYIMGSITGVLYVGMTGGLMTRVAQHKSGRTPGFTSWYRVSRLLYYEEFASPTEAIRREKEIKGWRREKKIELIATVNPKRDDLSAEWFT